MTFYHASNTANIKTLEPRVSNHNTPLIYFSDKRENVLVYLSNAVEKLCKEEKFDYSGVWSKWGSYGFEKDGRLRFEEYYPNALEDTYKGVQGYIYMCEKIEPYDGIDIQIPNAHVSAKNTVVDSCEYVADAYKELLEAERRGKIVIVRHKDFISSESRKEWLHKTIVEQYNSSEDHPEYRFFLKKKFSDILKN